MRKAMVIRSSCIHVDHAQVMEKLKALEARPVGSQSDVVVIGGNYAGVELSAVVAEKLGASGRVKVLVPCALDPQNLQRHLTWRQLGGFDQHLPVVTGVLIAGDRVRARHSAMPLLSPCGFCDYERLASQLDEEAAAVSQ